MFTQHFKAVSKPHSTVAMDLRKIVAQGQDIIKFIIPDAKSQLLTDGVHLPEPELKLIEGPRYTIGKLWVPMIPNKHEVEKFREEQQWLAANYLTTMMRLESTHFSVLGYQDISLDDGISFKSLNLTYKPDFRTKLAIWNSIQAAGEWARIGCPNPYLTTLWDVIKVMAALLNPSEFMGPIDFRVHTVDLAVRELHPYLEFLGLPELELPPVRERQEYV